MKVKELIECLSNLDLEREIAGEDVPGIVLIKNNGVTIKEVINLKELKYVLA